MDDSPTTFNGPLHNPAAMDDRRIVAIFETDPRPDQVDAVVRVLEAAHPKHFDARLERWRNTG